MKDGALILNVNDHAANLYLVSRMLRTAGFRVVEARTAEEALARTRDIEDRPRLLVLDVRLPDRSGFEVCRELKADPATRDVKILHTSATHVTSGDRIEGLDAGADGYLTQPFESRDLIATVRSLIRLSDVEGDLQERNTQLVDAGRRKDEFLAMLAHELRNPLAAIQMGLPLLERSPRDDIEGRTLTVMRRQTALLVQLVDDLLDVSRVTRGRIELALDTVELTELVRDCCEDTRTRLFTPRNQQLTCAIPVGAPPVYVRADAGRLEQVVVNLLDNASKYSDANTQVTVDLRAQAGRVQLRVRDHGVGIDPSALPRMFELFAQAQTSLARSRGGLGIGLTLVRTLVELHGGTISAASDGLGHGTELLVELPTIAAPAAMPREAVSPAPTAEACRILLVDDNEDARELMRTLLEMRGHAVESAGDGPSGVDAALAFRPHIAFIDIGLPGIDGYEVARRLRAAQADERPTLIALSGYGTAEAKRQAFESGFDDHVVKPVKVSQLEHIVADAHGKRAAT